MKIRIIDLAYGLSLVGFFLTALLVLYLGGMAAGAGMGMLPDKMVPTFELPITLSGLKDYYPVENLDPAFEAQKIEVKRAELEVLPSKGRQGLQALMYLYAALYVGCYGAILFFLSRTLQTFREEMPFPERNVWRLRWVGGIAILLSGLPWLMHTLVFRFLGEKFAFSQAYATPPSLADWDGGVLFLGIVMLALAEAFRQGTLLQDLEELTV
ncbi:MAG: DUF2975 domain-containing protein [Bacteroidota bacterium]